MMILCCLALALAVGDAAERTPMEFTKDTLAVVKEHVDKEEAVLVDARSQEEWDEGNLEGAIFLPMTSLRKGGDPEEIAEKLPKDKILYTFCVVGMRAKNAAKVLVKYGYEVRPLKPGYDELVEAGFKQADAKKK
jgi:phage shock protein E